MRTRLLILLLLAAVPAAGEDPTARPEGEWAYRIELQEGNTWGLDRADIEEDGGVVLMVDRPERSLPLPEFRDTVAVVADGAPIAFVVVHRALDSGETLQMLGRLTGRDADPAGFPAGARVLLARVRRGPPVRTAPLTDGERESVPGWILKLNDPEWAERESAGEALLALGRGVVPLLEAAIEGGEDFSYEQRIRLRTLLDRLDPRLDLSVEEAARIVLGYEPPERGGLRRFLGVSPVPGGEAEPGVAIDRVIPGTSAERGGLRSGDRIRSWNGEPVADMEAFYRLVRAGDAGEEIRLGILRDGEGMELRFPIGGIDDQPAFREHFEE